MSEAKTDRITPLPWSVKQREGLNSHYCEIQAAGDEIKSLHVATIQSTDGYASCGDIEGKTFDLPMLANAQYIVHACNTLPKLEALNAELVEALEEYLKSLRDHGFGDEDRKYTRLEMLLEKAKGAANG